MIVFLFLSVGSLEMSLRALELPKGNYSQQIVAAMLVFAALCFVVSVILAMYLDSIISRRVGGRTERSMFLLLTLVFAVLTYYSWRYVPGTWLGGGTPLWYLVAAATIAAGAVTLVEQFRLKT